MTDTSNIKFRHSRHFYSREEAFGRFALRQFRPNKMPEAHWHGHIELNYCEGADLYYDFDGIELTIKSGEMVVFWAGIPHQLIDAKRTRSQLPKQTNIYIPVDMFLLMPHIAHLQIPLLSGAVVQVPYDIYDMKHINQWYKDYRNGSFERLEVVKMELNTLFRRMLLDPLNYAYNPRITKEDKQRYLYSVHIKHVVEMTRFILENLEKPLRNSDVTAVTGLHENYATTLFSNVMRISIKKFMIRMRLLRARSLLIESTLSIAKVVETTGFSSTTQFYHHFTSAYGMPPNAMREHYVHMNAS